MLHPDFEQLAKAIGDVSADRLRIVMGATTALQRLVRKASTLPEIIALKKHFPDKERSYDPQPEEKEEYVERRKALFSAYLAGFNTLEEFKTFHLTDEGMLALNREEYDLGSAKLVPLLLTELEAAGDSLEALLKVRTLAEFYSEKCGLRDREFSDTLTAKLRSAFLKTLKETSGTRARVAVIEAMPISCYDLFGDRRSPYPWAFLWQEAKSLEECLFLEQLKKHDYVERRALELRLTDCLESEMAKYDTFAERFAAAEALAGRDGNRPDDLYGMALELAAHEVRAFTQLWLVIETWRSRRKKSRSTSSDSWPEIPSIMNEKYDEFRLAEVEQEEDVAALAQVANTKLYGTKCFQMASGKLEKYFDAKIAAAQTPEELPAIEAEAEALSLPQHYARTWERARELERARETREAEASLAKVARGEDDDPAGTLVGVYKHYVRMEDKEKAREVLFLLAPLFELEGVPQ